MKTLPTLLTLLTMISPSAFASLSVPAASPSVRVMGRVAEKDGSLTMAYPGIETVLRFSGNSTISLKGAVLGADTWFNLTVDGAAQPVVHVTSGDFTVKIAENLDPTKEHTVRLVRRNEAWTGLVRLDSFQLDDGAKTLAPEPLPARKILAIGDSITCGYNTEFLTPENPGPSHENAEIAYGWELAKDFGAQIHLVSYGGKGLVRDWRGTNTAMIKDMATEGTVTFRREVPTAPDFFERALPDDPASAWDHSNYVPDLVVICIGQNDFSAISLPVSEYAQAYIQFVDRIHKVYPKAPVLVLSSPMSEMSRSDGWQPRGIALQMAISLMDQHYIRLGDPVVMPLFVSHQPGTSLDSHPTGAQQKAMEEEMKPIVKFLTGWNEVR
jgi:lysophospholipase L1-like esterase